MREGLGNGRAGVAGVRGEGEGAVLVSDRLPG